ncbi:NADH-quinone oxidoreductase subunit J family protein [Muribaculum intestinale]|uniref:NADH-quinone oxidoreductase subunit J n=2 Tax=Muribaculum intestinale TaxID=1796646 RepID=A0A1B1SBF1_9BACT|nr:NADH-quinone oxidoreductase subunit J [Muribaculum intestinale]ROS79387.1 NADH-quinone oxidoreductase subunit J [Muribaculaceae bacterium Isolate-042 (Harlan)]ROT11298.1 NADH-quinone oxidoreductase subunit J [Muribaculaceae bacterium Isolate-100 (HZI)]RXE67309.1 NADH-quinone oxidoreductase subunit J [Muribaculaceae bacterium Isolate-007 (NCI)]ANU64159.1 NADH-quinone oxidoreductase subunit J [Muribaculum intestinale]ASB37747.1 NADH-quinone oxidoreductase subunit J [Muribaculum intestinale]
MESVGSIVMYWIIVASIIIFSILTVTTRRILRAATYLLFTLFATAGLYFKLDYEFLGAVQIAVYAGGIVVLVVFSILLTTKPGDASSQLTSRRRLFGGVASALALAGLGYAVVARPDFWSTFSRPFDGDFTMNHLGEVLLGTEKFGYLLPFEAVSVLLLACIIGGVVIARKR